jgi:hypothetical protein
MSRELRLPYDRYIAALKRILSQIKEGSKLEAEDSETVGDKYTTCSWGLCSHHKEQWPDKQDYLFPPRGDGTVAVKYKGIGQNCPFDKNKEAHPDGCFHRCRIFQDLKNPPTREEAIFLYEITLINKGAKL